MNTVGGIALGRDRRGAPNLTKAGNFSLGDQPYGGRRIGVVLEHQGGDALDQDRRVAPVLIEAGNFSLADEACSGCLCDVGRLGVGQSGRRIGVVLEHLEQRITNCS